MSETGFKKINYHKNGSSLTYDVLYNIVYNTTLWCIVQHGVQSVANDPSSDPLKGSIIQVMKSNVLKQIYKILTDTMHWIFLK